MAPPRPVVISLTPKNLINARLISFFQADSYFDRGVLKIDFSYEENVLKVTTRPHKNFFVWVRLPKLIRFLKANQLPFERIFIDNESVTIRKIIDSYPGILKRLESRSIEARLKMEQEFYRRQRNRLEALKGLLAPQASIAIIGLDGVYRSPDSLIGMTVSQLVGDPIESDRILQQLHDCYEEGRTIEIRWSKPNGEHWKSKITPVAGENEIIAVCERTNSVTQAIG